MILRSQPRFKFSDLTYARRYIKPLGSLLLSCFLLTCAKPGLADTPLRVMAANTTSGNRQSYDPGEGTRIFQGLVPDVVLIQEFNVGDNSDGVIARWVTDTFGPEFSYYREEGAQIPNGVISRYPIIAAGEWNDAQVGNRDFAWAQIDVPGEIDLWAVSVHFLTRNGSVRSAQARALRRLVEENVPEGDYLVIGGDLNTRNSGEAALDVLDALVNTDGPYPVDQDGVIGTNASRRRPYDWVFADEDLETYEVPVQIGSNTFPDGLVFDSRVYSPLADVAPARRGDSGATNMQHMAVIRDFTLPEGVAEIVPIQSEPSADNDAINDSAVEPAIALDPIGAAPIESCEPVRGFAAEDQWRHYGIVVPEGALQLEVDLNGSGGDLDLYVRKDELPTLREYDFRPWFNDSNEQVVVNANSAVPLSPGTWYVSVNGFIPSDYELLATIDKCR